MTLQRLIPVVLAALVAAPAGAQSPLTDGLDGPIVGRSLPRAAARSAELPGIYDNQAWVQTPALPVEDLLREDRDNGGGALRMGVVQDLAVDSGTHGAWAQLADGGWLWTAQLRVTGAVGARVRMAPWPPAPGAEVTFTNALDPSESYGPFGGTWPTGDGTFWSPALYSQDLHVEYYLPAWADHTAAAAQIRVTGVLNQYRNPIGNPIDELGCHLDTTCFASWANPSRGVGALSTVTNQFGFFCSGSMLNRIPADFAPLFQTATHCGITTGNATSILVTWFYQTTTCNVPGTVPALNTLPQTMGSALLAQDVTTDWTLIGLTAGIPGGLWWQGWDAGFFSNGSTAVGIHHPDGAYKRISFGSKTADGGFRPNPAGGTLCVSGTSSTILYPQNSGLTEPGSSGSPIFDSSARVRGALSCAFSNCNSSNQAFYGRLDQAFPFLAPFLTPPDPVFANVGFGGTELGTAGQPFRSVAKSKFSVISGHTVNIQAGNYHEPQTIDRAMTLQATGGIVTIGP